VLYLKDYIIVSEGKQEKILLFYKTGKFIRMIGGKGQGPDEYLYLTDIAFNEQEQCLYVSGRDKILCYDLNGNYIKKTTLKNTSFFEYICYTNGSLSVISTTIGEKAENGFINRTVLYHIDNNLQIIDSLEIKKVLLSMVVEALNSRSDYINFDDKNTYLYYPVLPSEAIVRDTLYRLGNSELVPCLKIRFSDEGSTINGKRSKNILNIFKSQRFVFVQYLQKIGKKGLFLFCYDTKTDKGYNMENGVDDDIHHTGKVDIRPLDLAAGTFYYLHTKEDESLEEEPNPTLYIGTLKK
jgi:hypothetical protein